MDPLSITVSTIALIELGLKIVKGLQILRDLSHVPDDIAALIDELHDLQDVLTAVCVATKHKASAAGLHQCSDELKSLLSKTGQTFRSIASHCGVLVEERHKPLQDDFVTAIESPSNVDLLTRFRWLKDRKRIDHYRRRLKILRLDINSHLASQNLINSSTVLIELRDLAAAFRKLSTDHSNLHAIISQSPPRVNTHCVLDQADLTESPISPPAYEPMAVTAPAVPSMGSATTHGDALRPLSTCSCSCHRVTKARTPSLALAVIGSFTVSAQGLSMLTPACDEIACKRSMHSSINVSYRFPPWLSSSALHSMLYTSRATGPQMSLTSTRIISRNSDIFCFAMQGDILGIKELFSKGLASPFDATNNYGYTALHYAIDYGRYDLCNFLLKAGANGTIQDFAGRTSTDIAYQKLCAPSFDPRAAERVRELFDKDSWLEEKQFTSLHKIVLRLINTGRSLFEELFLSTKDINTVDSDGRTPVSWAAEHRGKESVSTLLQFGADVNKADKDGNTPLHYACSCDNGPAALSLLLAAGAIPTARNKWGQTSLNWASFFQNDPSFVEKLLKYPGVDLSEADKAGCTALGNAAFRANEKMLSYLLDVGVDINAAALDSSTPLMNLISMNGHTSLAIILEKSRQCGLNFAKPDDKGECCLHYLARRADLETVRIFARALKDGLIDPAGLDTAAVGHDGLTARDLLSLRGNEEVKEAMRPILQRIQYEVESEKSSVVSVEEIVYLDAEEFLPQLEKDIGFKGGLRIAVKEVELVSLV